MISNAKLAYLLSTCPKLNNGLMRAMLKQYGSSKTVATRHYFNLWVVLHEPDIGDFRVKNVKFKFADSEDPVIINAMQYNNWCNLTTGEMTMIHRNLLKTGIKLNVHQIVALYSIATLIKKYKEANFKYLFIPVIIDYGRGGGVVHQTAILIDLHEGKFIFYEPYGLYAKYNKSYKYAIEELLLCFDNFPVFKDTFEETHQYNKIKFTTYHDMLNVNKGIQGILLNKNNSKSDEFDIQYNKILNQLEEAFPHMDFNSLKKKNVGDDKTYNVLELLHNIDNLFIDDLSDDKKQVYYKLLNDTLTQYFRYNSKTCVSITITEMNEFFNLSQEGLYIKDISKKIKEIYTQYINAETPNIILMDSIYKLADLLKTHKNIKNLLENVSQVNDICKKL
jgi:hypothetical protein